MSENAIIIKHVRKLCERHNCRYDLLNEYLGKVLTDDTKLTASDIEKLADVFGVSECQLVGKEDLTAKDNNTLDMSDFDAEDLKAIGAVNRIARNSSFMEQMFSRCS